MDKPLARLYTLKEVSYISTLESKWRDPQHRVLRLVYQSKINLANENMNKHREIAMGMIDMINQDIGDGRDADYVIAPVVHKIWLSNPIDPRPPLAESVRSIVYMCETHPEIELWLWTNVPDILKNSAVLQASRVYSNFKIMDASDRRILNFPICKYVDHLIDERFFAHASNLLRLAIVYEFGGIHTDFGFIITKLGMQYIRRFTHTFNTEYWDPGCCGHATFSATRHSPVLGACIKLFENMTPELARMFRNNRINLVSYSSPAALAAFVAMELDPTKHTLLLFTNPKHPERPKMYSNWHSMGSYRSGALGNRTMDDCSNLFPWLFTSG